MDNIVKMMKNHVGPDKEIGRCFKSYDNGHFTRSYHCDDDNFIDPRRVDSSKIVINTEGEIIFDRKLSDSLFFKGFTPEIHDGLDAKEFLFETFMVTDLPHTFDESNEEVWQRFWKEFYEVKLKTFNYLYMN